MRGPSRLIIVRRGERALFMAILHSRSRWPARTALMVDRRERERRVRLHPVTVERRRRQRRVEPDPMWYLRGFVVVETDQLPVQASRLGGLAP